MESNNHFNYGTHSSANSGLKRSSGDSLYTNGSSMSFSQQGKNLNGEMNVNGVTTVLGSGVSGSHPPTAPYQHMSNHHQSSMGYDYLWGGHPQYGPTMGASPGHGIHQKQPTPGMVQTQSQHHFQSHGQYQLNGGIESSHQPPVAGPPNMPQYWNRNNPGTQQLSYNSQSMYGTYQSQTHPGIASSQHHQQPSLQPPSQQHLQSHRQLSHHHQQHQQPHHYGMMPNGMPYFQHPSQQPQQTPQHSPSQSQAQMIPPASQSFTPPRGSPMHHGLDKGGTGSPLPMGMPSGTMMSLSAVQDSGSPKAHSRERSPHASSAGISSAMQGHPRETIKEVDSSYNGMERASVAQRLPMSDSYQPKSTVPASDCRHHSEQSAAQHPEMASSVRESAMNTPPRSGSSLLSASPREVATSLTKDSTPPRVSAVYESPTSAPGSAIMSTPNVESSPAQMSSPSNASPAPSPAAPPRLSSSPLMMMQGLRPELSPTTSQHLSAGSSSSSLLASSSKLSILQKSADCVSRPATGSSVPAVSAPLMESVTHQTESLLPPTVSGPPALVPLPSYALSAPMSSLQQMVQGSKSPLQASVSQHEKSRPTNTTSASSSEAEPSSAGVAPPIVSLSGQVVSHGSCVSKSASTISVSTSPSVYSKPCDPLPTAQCQTYTPPAADSSLSTYPVVSFPPGMVNSPSLTAHGSPPARPRSTLPLLTTQASRTAPVSDPPALVSVPPAMGMSSGVMQSSDSEQYPLNSTPVNSLKQSFSKPGHHVYSENSKALAKKMHETAEEDLPQLDSQMRTSQLGDTTETYKSEICSPESLTDLPGKSFHVTVALDQKSNDKQTDSEEHYIQSSDFCESEESILEQTAASHSSHLHSTRVDQESLAIAHGFDGDATLDSPSRIGVSSILEKSSLVDYNSSCVGDSSHHESSFHLKRDPSEFNSDSEAVSIAFETTRHDQSSVSRSRDDTLDSTDQEETSEAQETKARGQTAGVSMLESSLTNASQTSVESDVSNLQFFVPSRSGHEASEGDSELGGHDTPDTPGHGVIKTTAHEAVTPPSFMVRDKNFIAFSTPAEGPVVHPLQAVSNPITSGAEVPQKTPGKPRKPRVPTAIWNKNPAFEEVQRKSRVRIPKVEKTDEERSNKENSTKGRRRRKPLKLDVNETSIVCGEGKSPKGEVDPITATINAVLANASAFNASAQKPKKARRMKKQHHEGGAARTLKRGVENAAEHVDDNDDDSSTAGESNKRRVATEEQVQFPLQHGWKREIRVKKIENRMKGETWYYTPCGRRMKQFPEIIKYLKKHSDSVVTREHFSFSPRMPVGDFYEERESPEGVKWVLLANEEIPSMIMAITGRRGRPPNPDKEKPRRVCALRGGPARRPGRPPKPKMIDLLSKVDAKLLKRLEAKEALTEEEKEKLAKIKKKMKRKARMKRRADAKVKKLKAEKKKLEQEAKGQEVKSEAADSTAPPVTQPTAGAAVEPRKPGRRRSVKVEAAPPVQQTDEERIAQGKRVLGARSKAKALAKAQAEAEAAAQAALAAKRAAERRAQAQRRLEERKRQQLIAEELKKPTEDMCLTDHKLLPELSHIPGVVLSGMAFARCLAVVEFLHGYGKVIGLNVPKDVPSLATLQEGLLGLGDSVGEVQDLLIKLVEAALHDPGLPSYYQSVKILGDKLVELQLTRNTVSEVLRIFLESHGYDTEVCNTLRTKTFHALPPDTKAAILGFLVEELNGSNIVTNDIDNTLENMATYRKNKWIIEGKLRKLKAALARRTGRSEEELCFEERRRSARVAEEENLGLEESGLSSERGSRRGRKEEPKLSDSESPANASIPELERQIDKLTKRQAFFRKKLLLSSHSMRATLLGQDRYRRRYLVLPHLGGVLVEGPEELLTSGDVLVAEVPVYFLKKEPKVEETPTPTTPPPTLPSSPSTATPAQSNLFSQDGDPLPGTASLMSRQRGRGRPRKIKPEVELHLRTAKIRRRRRSTLRSGSDGRPGSPGMGLRDLTQVAFQSWLSQSQEGMTNGTCSAAGDAPEGNRPEESVKEVAEKQGQWFNLLPKQPCDNNSLVEPQAPSSPGSPPQLLPQIPTDLPELVAPHVQPDPLLPGAAPAETAIQAPLQDIPPTPPTDASAAAAAAPDSTPPAPPQLLPAPVAPATPVLSAPARTGRRRRRGSRGSSPARRGSRASAAKRRGRPPNSVFQELEQQYFTQLVVRPIPASMVRGWWWIKDPEELYNTLQALHPRGVRERVLHKHLAKHMESLTEMCTKPIEDPMFELKAEDKDVLIVELQKPWQVQEKAMETDISVLKWVEDLEQRVIAADLHMKALPQSAVNDAEANAETPIAEFQPYTIPDPDSTRDDLQYYEHDTDPHDDWIVRTKKEWSGLPRIATHPVDLAVLRLANLERNIERRYLKEPLWNPAEVMRLAPLTPTPGEEHPMDVISLESEITSRLRTWRQALDRCRSAPQVCLCVLQLEKAIAWERSVTKVTCQVCRKGDNDDCLLLCDSCDRGCHMYCLKPKITQVPEGDWFCPTCVAQNESSLPRSCKKRTRVKKRRYEDESSEDDVTTRRSGGMATRFKDSPAPSSSHRNSTEGSAAKRRRMTTRNQPDLTFCEIILMEMEAHTDAWPFLEPVNPRLVPGYRRIIKNPMDFLTMRERLLQGGYCSCEDFAADAQLVFNNCELFNEDTSEVGMAGHAMRRFFESRWAEFYSNKDK